LEEKRKEKKIMWMKRGGEEVEGRHDYLLHRH
jgi:hypothetical protein